MTDLEIAERSSPFRAPEVCVPLPGRYSTREGERLQRDELLGPVDEWLELSSGQPRFVIQGGNRYISHYVHQLGYDALDLKLSAIHKAPLAHHLRTLMTEDELVQVLPAGNKSRRAAIDEFDEVYVKSPFSSITRDLTLETELAEAVDIIESDAIEIPNIDEAQAAVAGTRLAAQLTRPGELHFIDDLFYRGRTIFTLAALTKICGGDPSMIRVTTIGCDPKSRDLETPYHTVLRPDVLYPFENSVRTEQGYWHDNGSYYEFVDMGAHLEQLHEGLLVTPAEATDIYKAFKDRVCGWSTRMLGDGVDLSLAFPSVWLSIYHARHGLPINIEKVVDQKGHKIGASAAFMALLDRFISQEETVEARSGFKLELARQLEAVQSAATAHPKEWESVVSAYSQFEKLIDYGYLTKLFALATDQTEGNQE